MALIGPGGRPLASAKPPGEAAAAHASPHIKDSGLATFAADVLEASREVPVTIERDGQTIALAVHPNPETRFEIGNIGVLPDINPVIRSVIAGEPADKAGLKPGDIVIAVNGERVVLSSDLVKATSKNAGKPIELTIRRSGQEMKVPMTPVLRDGRVRWTLIAVLAVIGVAGLRRTSGQRRTGGVARQG